MPESDLSEIWEDALRRMRACFDLESGSGERGEACGEPDGRSPAGEARSDLEGGSGPEGAGEI